VTGSLPLQALEGTNPLGFLAALGVLDALARAGRAATLRWDDDVVPYAVLGGVRDLAEILDVLDDDRQYWAESPVLNFPSRTPLRDAKPSAPQLRDWYETVARAGGPDADLLCAIVAEGAFDRSGQAKPTHLHFTAGQQQFLDMVRVLAAEVTRDHLTEAIDGPWSYKSPLPSLSWDVGKERVYAVRARNPSGSSEKRLGVPGADWLAFRGLIMYPVSLIRGALQTTACDRAWKDSAFRWPLWSVPATCDVVRSLVADERLVSGNRSLRPGDLAARGILRVLQAPIRRSDQGGYGTFGGPVTLADSTMAGEVR
jgi:hypothetical protein